MFAKQRLLALIALRNVSLHRVKSVTIGLLLSMGTLLLTLGLTLLTNIERSMEESITQSLAGHFQLYSKSAKDELALFGGNFMSREDVGSIPEFQNVKNEILKIPGVKGVMPMGIDMSLIPKGNTFDELFDGLRAARKAELVPDILESVEKIRFQLSLLKLELQAGKRIDSSGGNVENQLALLAQTENENFWQGIETISNDLFEEKMSFLETKIAKLAGEQQPLYMRFVGMNPQNFSNLFPKFKILRGADIPPGKRGLLLSHKLNEDFFKNVAARTFDKIHKKITKAGAKISNDDETKRFVADLPRQYLQIQLYLSSAENQELMPKFKSLLGSSFPQSEKISDVLKEYLKTNDDNFMERYNFFYSEIAPKIVIYPIKEGQTVIMRSYTRSGYVRTLPVPVYGVFTFEGLENSDLSGGFSLVDLVTFRDLYGVADESSAAENAELSEQLKAVASIRVSGENGASSQSENLEDALFGETSSPQAQLPSSNSPERENTKTTDTLLEANKNLSFLTKPLSFKPVASETYDIENLDKGLALNLAVVANASANRKSMFEQLKVIAEKNNLKAVDWKEASGIVGQFVTIVRSVLIVGVAVIVLVALLIINNSLIVSTLDRVREIGTMRAIGAQRSFVRQLFLWETGTIAFFGTLLGAIVSLAVLIVFQVKGIPAPHPMVEFLFSGPRLFPNLSFGIVILVPLLVILLSVGSSFYAASFASKITPAEAMADKE